MWVLDVYKRQIKDILKLNINYMLHEDYGHYSYTEHYSLGDIFIYTSADEEKGVDVYKRQVYIKELSAPAGYKVDKTIYPLTIKAGETATLNVSDTPKVTDTLIERCV